MSSATLGLVTICKEFKKETPWYLDRSPPSVDRVVHPAHLSMDSDVKGCMVPSAKSMQLTLQISDVNLLILFHLEKLKKTF